MHEHRHRIFGMDHLRHEFIGTQSSPEDEACSRSQQERVTAFTPLSDRSLVVLATEIEDLKAHIEDMNKQHVEEVGELITENKHLQEHIRKIQDELEHSREMSVIHTNHHEERLAELEQHIRNLEAEIGRRQQRQLILIEDNDSLSAQLQLLQEECQRYRRDSLHQSRQYLEVSNHKQHHETPQHRMAELEKDKLALQSENQLLMRTVEAIRNEKEQLERDVQCLLELRSERAIS